MFKKSVRVFIIVAVLSLLTVFSASADYTADGIIDNSNGCMNVDGFWDPVDIQSFVAPATGVYTFTYLSHTWGGDIFFYVIPDAYNPSQPVVGQATAMFGNDSPSDSTLFIAGQTYYVAANNNQGFGTESGCESRERTNTGEYSFSVDEPSGVNSVSMAGCDMQIELPDTAVVGAITDYAIVYWKPGAATGPAIVLDPGKTYWMDGVDETTMYRYTLISCEWLWVETAKTSPNYDAVWRGTPLPTHTVDY